MVHRFQRIILIILDGVGIGHLPDADKYGDVGSNTLLHIHEKVGLSLVHLSKLGLSQLLPLATPAEVGAWGTMEEKSAGKDSTTGHWEIAGIVLEKPFPTYPNGFPDEVIRPFTRQIKRDILGNCVASGTEIIQRLGDEHVRTGRPIVYTSADSVFQIAAHEKVIPLQELYKMCEIAREILQDPHNVGRVIARPFVGESGHYQRTENRHDYSIEPIGITVLDALCEKGFHTTSIGKIADIFAKRGLQQILSAKGNPECIEATINTVKNQPEPGLIFTNLVDFDTLYGHRNNPRGFAEALEYFDQQLPTLLEAMTQDDLLLITADHGNDPTTPSTDHSREYVPLLAYHKNMTQLHPLGVRGSFTDVAKTIDDNFQLKVIQNGRSFLEQLDS